MNNEEKWKIIQKIEGIIAEKEEQIRKLEEQKKEPETAGYLQAEWVKCGKTGCKCNNGDLHGTYWYLYKYAKGKSSKLTKIYIGKVVDKELREGIENRKHNLVIIAKIKKIQKQIRKIEANKEKIAINLKKIDEIEAL